MSIVGIDPPRALWTVRIGQLTGTTGERWPNLVDAEHWPLLTDTGHWGMWGVDLGANTEHSAGRLYFFFGDTAEKPHVGVPRNADLVAWTEDREILRHGGHQRQGFTFFLPSEEQQHATEKTGQGDWRFCSKCHGLFFAPHGSAAETVCPADGGLHDPQGFTFFLPSHEEQGATVKTGQGDWRFCANCHGLFFDGFPAKGVCPGALGGGIRLHAVLAADGNLDPFRAAEPFGVTGSNETPQGAFSFGGTAYVFAGIAPRRFSFKKRPVNPTYGNYLHSKARPDVPGEFHTEFLFSPRIGWCPTDTSRTAFESHRALGLRFVIQTGGKPGPGWRACHKCDSMFWDGADVPSVCHKGGRHEAKATTFVVPTVSVNDGQHQDLWFRCRNCASLFFNGSDGNKGLCPAGGEHVADELTVSVAHATFDEDIDMMDTWRFCHKCAGLFRDDFTVDNHCKAGGRHEATGFEFVLPHDFNDDDGDPPPPPPQHPQQDDHHQRAWFCCGKCAGMFFNGFDGTNGQAPFKGVCPKDGDIHTPSGNPQSSQEFFLPHDLPADATHQDRWQFCTKCAGMFFNGFDGTNGQAPFKGVCPKDGGAHDGQGHNFVFAHNPGADAFAEDGWRFCGRCFAMVDTKHADFFSAAAACVVNNADHPELPQGVSERAVVLLGFGWVGGPTGKPASSRIAWMPLREGEPPRLTDTRYFSGDPKQWSESADDAVVVFEHDGFTSVSLAWLEGPRRWICLYSMANDSDDKHFDRPAVARIGGSPWDWSPAISIFDPRVDSHAPPAQKPYGLYMHKKPLDTFHPDIPPAEPKEHPGWAYGAYLLNRFTEWDETSRELTISYLLSLSCPYQPQLMQTRMQVESPIRRAAIFAHLAVRLLADARQAEGIDRAGAAIQAYTEAASQPGANRDAIAAGLTDVNKLLTAIVPPVQQPLVFAQTLRALAAAQQGIGRIDQAADVAQQALRVDLGAVDDVDPMTVTSSLTRDAGLLSTVGLTAKAVDTQQTVIDLLRAFTPAEANRLEYLITVAEAQHNLIVRLVDDHRPSQAAGLARQTIEAYRGYIAAGGTDVSRLNQDITDLQKLLNSPAVGLTAEPVELLQLLVATFRAAPPPQSHSGRLTFQITFAEARHNLIARLLDDHRPTEARALVAETVAAYRNYATETGADLLRAASDLTQLVGVLAGGSLTAESQSAQQAADEIHVG